MESTKLYIKQIKDGEESLFPSDEMPVIIGEYTYEASRMSGAPTITAKFMHPLCLDDMWTYTEYVEYKGEKYYVRQIPSSSKSYEDTRYQYDITLVSEREILGNEYFYDVVTADTDEQYKDRYRSNLSDFSFSGDLKEFVSRINDSLIYTKLYDKETGEGYYVVIDDGIDTSETVDIQFSNKYIVEALQEINTSFKQAYYFVGKTIHVGFLENDISTVFEYGKGNGLLKVEKQNSNKKIVDRITGTGSSDNIPYYYPNPTPYGVAKWESTQRGSVLPDVEDINLSTINKYCGDAIGKEFILCYHPTEASYNFGEQFFSGVTDVVRFRDSPKNSRDVFLTIYSRDFYIKKGDEVYSDYFSFVPFETSVSVIDLINGTEIGYNDPSVVTQKVTAVFCDAFYGTELSTVDVTTKSLKEVVTYQNIYTRLYFKFTLQFINLARTYNFGNNTWAQFRIRGKVKMRPLTIRHRYTSEYSESGYYFDYRGKGDTYYKRIAYEKSGIKFRNLEQLPCLTEKVEFIDNNESFGFITYVDGSTNIGALALTITGREWITPSYKLMPSIYRQSLGGERYYNAENDKYEKDGGGYYVFNNLYEDGNPHSNIQSFDEIKPTIKDIVNSQGQHFGEIADIAFDDNNNDEVKQSSNNSNEYIHPYFYIKLHKFDGDGGFNLFEAALESGKAMIEMTSGTCVGCKFEIGVPSPTKVSDGKYVFHNPVQVDNKGNIVAGDYGDKVKENTYQERQQDTTKNEVWIALKKEESTYGIIMPNAANNYKPAVGDTFVITNINLPMSYIYDAEKRLDKALVKFMHENNTEKFNFSIEFSRIFLANNPDIVEKLNENARLTIKYNGYYILLFVTNYTAKSGGDILEEVTVDLNEDLTVTQSNFALRLQEMKNDIVETIAGLDLHLATKEYYLSRRGEELSGNEERTAQGKLYLQKGADFGDFIKERQGGNIDADGRAEMMSLFVRTLIQSVNFETGVDGKGFKIWEDDNGVSHMELDEVTLRNSMQSEKFISGFSGNGFKLWEDNNGLVNLELDKLTVRQIMTVFELVIDKIRSVGGQIIVSAANGKIKEVSETEEEYVITFEDDCYFLENDFMRCQTFSGTDQRGYWVEINGSGSDFVTVPKSEFEEWNTIPKAGDEVVLMGNSTNTSRQNLISISATEDGQPRIDILNGVNEKNFNRNLRARLGNLDGINDDWFPVNNQPHGDGLYADNAYLRGTFLLTTGEDIKTKFEIIEGKITSSVESVRKDMEDGFLRNGSFVDGASYWSLQNTIDVLSLSSRFVWANDGMLSRIKGGASLFADGDRMVMRIVNGMIVQKSKNYINLPDLEVNQQLLYEPIPVTLSFLYKVKEEGNIAVFFENIDKTNTVEFDDFTCEAELSVSDEYKTFSASGLWNCTGDLTIYFEGEILLHSITLKTDTGDRIAYKYRTLFEQSDKLVRIAAENFDMDGKVIEQSDIITTAKYNSLMSKYFKEDGSLVNLAGIVTTTDFDNFKKTNEEFTTGLFDSIAVELDDLSNDVNTNYVKIESFAGMFASAVDENGIAKTSQLSSYVAKQTGEDGKSYLESGVLIKADSINLEGYMTINGNFHVDEEGKIHATDGEFNGVVRATDGEFNGVVRATDGEFNGDLTVGTMRFRKGFDADTRIITGAYIDTEGEYILPSLQKGEFRKISVINPAYTRTYIQMRLSCEGPDDVIAFNKEYADIESSQAKIVELTGIFELWGCSMPDGAGGRYTEWRCCGIEKPYISIIG